jgi:nucleotide-binding universal stress UspA family protein
MNRILIATDGSPSAQEAVDFGIELAADQGAALTFVEVVPAVDIVPSGGFGVTGAVPHDLTEAHTEVLEQARARAEAAGVTAYTRLLRGDAVDEVVAYADSTDTDLIVVGSRGHGSFTSALLGSVSRGVLQEARRPVLVVRAAASRHHAEPAGV